MSACLLLGLAPPPVAAQSEKDSLRLPLFEVFEGGASRVVWSPGVRRVPAFLAALRASSDADFRAFLLAAKGGGAADKSFVRSQQERMASDRFESVVVMTEYRDVPSVHADNPRTYDTVAGKEIGWADLLDPATSTNGGARAIHDFARRALNRQVLAARKDKDLDPAKLDKGIAVLTARLAPTLDGLPPFALVPATDGVHVAGLSLVSGAKTPNGLVQGEPLASVGEVFLPAETLKPWLAPAYRDVFGGAANLFDQLRRERIDDVPSGSSAVMLTKPQKPGKTLTFIAEAPSTFFARDEIEVVVNDEALGLPAEQDPNNDKSFVAIGHAVPNARPSGVGFDLRVFSVTIRYKVDAFAAVCRGAAMRFRAAKGSPAANAKLPWIDMWFPLDADCRGYEG